MQIGPYTVEEELARGGMGVVYRARGPDGQEVAVKLLLQVGGPSAAERRERFRREVEALSRLRHPGVVPVIDAGQERGNPYLVMELIRGESLDAVLVRSGQLPVQQAVTLTHEIALALHYAHTCGLLHRDLKPGNLLLEEGSGRARLTDFGLVKDLDRATLASLSKSGHMLGTPGYWSPEQAAGKRDRVDARSDVYGLGATLYALLTGDPPYRGESLIDVVSAMSEPPQPPSRRRPEIDASLDRIVLRCLAHEPEDRYDSADALARDLGAWLRQDPAPSTRTSRGPMVLAASLLLAGLGVAAGVVFTRATAPGQVPSPAAPPSPPLTGSPDALSSPESEQDPSDRRASQLLLLSRQLSEQGAIAKARTIAEKGLELARLPETRADLLVQHGWTLVDGDLPAAWAKLGEALELAPELPSAHLLAARLLFLEGDEAGAEQELTRLLSADPPPEHAFPGLMGRANVYLSQERLGEAEADLDQVVTLRPDHPTGWAMRGHLRLLRGELEGALADVEQAVLLGGTELTTLRNRVQLLRRLGRGDEALAEVARARKLHPRSADLVALESVLLLEGGRHRQAEKAALAVIEAVPRDPLARGVLAYVTARYGVVGMARDHLNLIQGDATACALLAAALVAEGEGDSAQCDALMAEALRLDPKILFPLAVRGLVRQQRGDASAMEDFDAVLARYPDHLSTLLDRCLLHYTLGDLTASAADATRAVELAPEFSSARITRAMVRRRHDDLPGAIRDLNRALELEPESEEAREMLLTMTWLNGERDEAIVACQQLLGQARPGTPWFRGLGLRLAAFLYVGVDREAADAALRDAYQTDARSWGYAVHQRAMFLYELDEHTAARENLTEALKHLPPGEVAERCRSMLERLRAD